MDFSLIQKIQTALTTLPLPGRAAQFEMNNIPRSMDYVAPADAKVAAVMLLLYPQNEQWHTVLIQRTSHNENDKHSGQISFPGGKFEKEDMTLDICAKRETFEEVGVPMEDIQVMGALTSIYIPVSHFHVFPYMAYLKKEPQWKEQKSEVVEILKVPVTHFLDERNKSITTIKVRDFVLKDIPYFDVHGKKVWGATAMILNEFNHILKGL